MKTMTNAVPQSTVQDNSCSKEIDAVSPIAPVESRLVTLDALRGFALCVAFIGGPLVSALHQLPPSAFVETVADQLTHVDWDGISLIDVGWPGFLCATGISLSYSLTRRLARGETKFSILLGLFRKSLLCVVFAFFLSGGFSVPLGQIYFAGLFFRYAATIFVAGAAELFLGFRGVLVLVCLLIVGYSAVTLWGTYYCLEEGYQSPTANFDLVVERFFGSLLLAKYLWYFPRTLTTCLGGLLIARIFQSNITPQCKVWWLVGVGNGTFALSWLMDVWIPINKRLWSTSFTLCAFGVTCLFLATFFQIIEVWGMRAFTMPWAVFGTNPLAAWAANELMPFDQYAQRAVGHVFEPVLGAYNGVLLAFVQVGLLWLLFYELYRRRIFIRLG